MQAVTRLIQIMKALRDPDQGCPWDREQTIASILPYTLEEVYELADAIDRNDVRGQCEELGDLLFHIVFYSQLAAEAGAYGFTDVVDRVVEKLERRHPHVFGTATIDSAAQQCLAWERLKAAERCESGAVKGLLEDIPRQLPALFRALKLQKRAASVGFDWPEAEPVLGKLEEEIKELREALRLGTGTDALADEIGDILFSAVNCARHAGVDPENALRRSNRKFERRFARIEKELAARGKTLDQATLEEMERIWQAAKRQPGDG